MLLELATKTLCYKSKTSKVDYIKIDSFCSLKVTSKKEKRQTTECKNMLVILKKDSYQEYAEFLKIIKENTDNSV